MTTAKNKVFTRLQHANYYLVGRMGKLNFGGGWGGGGGSTGEIFPGGGMRKFSAGGRGLAPSFPVGKLIHMYHRASLCTDPPRKPQLSNFFCPLSY